MATDDVGLLFVLKAIQIQMVLLILVQDTGASYCTEEQLNNCRQSARDGTLSKLAGGGECQVKRYVQFTHLCTVNNYVPSTDYCCCAHDRKILCCRYHYDWNYFRCAEAEDVIDTIADSALPQELLLTAILVPTAAALCCIICCIRCLCCRDDEEDNCTCSKCKICNIKESSKKYSVGQSRRGDDVETPLKSQNNTKQPLPDQRYDDVRGGMLTSSLHPGAMPSVPSAPPIEDVAQLLPRPMSTSGTSGSSGYLLQYLPLEHGQLTAPPRDGALIVCPYRELHANQRPDNTYHVTTEQFPDSLKCGHVTQSQTLIGILSNPDGKPIVAERTTAPPSDPPPAYDDPSSDVIKTHADSNTGS